MLRTPAPFIGALGVMMDPSILPIGICVLVGAACLTPMLLARRRADIERGLVPHLEMFCSGRGTTGFRTNIPMFRIAIYDGFLVVVEFVPVAIPFSEIAHAEIRGKPLKEHLFLQTKRGGQYTLNMQNPERAIKFLHDVER